MAFDTSFTMDLWIQDLMKTPIQGLSSGVTSDCEIQGLRRVGAASALAALSDRAPWNVRLQRVQPWK